MDQDMTKTILVTGSTGFQGRSAIKSLLASENDSFHILALTRNPTSPSAQSLTSIGLQEGVSVARSRVELVQGNLDEPKSIRDIFERRKETGGVWGVLAVLTYPGLGANADGEQRQGIMMADLAFEFGVSHFIYSSNERGGESFDDSVTLSMAAKVAIERHVRSLGEKGLIWTILRPTFFMENFRGQLGKIAVGVMKAGLRPNTKLHLIASEDIGHIAAIVFTKPETYKYQIIVVIGDSLTMQEQDEAYKRATGRPQPSIPRVLAKLILKLNIQTKNVVLEQERLFEARQNLEGGFTKILADAKTIYPQMTSFEEFVRKSSNSAPPSGWNKLSLVRLLKGKS